MSEGGTVENRSSQRDLIRIFQFITDGDASGQNRQFHRVRLQLSGDIEIGGISLHRTAQSQEHLLHPTSSHPFHEFVNSQIRGSNSFNRRDYTTEHMIKPIELLRVLHSHHILDVLHDADQRGISFCIGANGTYIGITDIMAHLAVFHVVTQKRDRLCEAVNILDGLT